jgi:plasmid replication initiation protein
MKEEGKNKEITEFKKFNKEKPVFIGSELFDGTKRYNLSANAQKLLFTLAQSLDHTNELFPLWQIDIRNLFTAMGRENHHDRYDVVREAFNELANNSLLYRISSKKWGGMSWFQSFDFDGDNSFNIEIQFSERAKDLLLCLKRYVEVKPIHYSKLSQYGMYLYPMLKNELYLSKKHSKYTATVEKSIDFLKEFMFCDKTKSYENNTNFLFNVIGIQRSRSNDDENANNWEYATLKKNGNELTINSTLYEISKNTDIEVTAEAVKKGKAYNSIKFHIQLKKEAAEKRQAKNKENAVKQGIAQAETKKNKSNSAFERQDMQHQSVVLKNANEAGLSVEKYAKIAGYVKKGEWYILYKKKAASSIADVK